MSVECQSFNECAACGGTGYVLVHHDRKACQICKGRGILTPILGFPVAAEIRAKVAKIDREIAILRKEYAKLDKQIEALKETKRRLKVCYRAKMRERKRWATGAIK